MRVAVSALLALMIGVGGAFAQAPTPTPPTAKMSPDDKKAISKSCSDQANAKGLHGKERKKFRSECKHNAGKPQ
jgi:psiF repeat-containing protein